MRTRKLILYSDQEIPENRLVDLRLLELLGDCKEIAYVASEPDHSRTYYLRKRSYYAQYGIRLGNYYDSNILKSTAQADILFSNQAIHLSGGNTPSFLFWLKELDLVTRFNSFIEAGGLLIGNSAGSILMSPDIRTATLVGDVMDKRLTDIEALNLVEFHVWPHFKEIHDSQINEHRNSLDNTALYKMTDGSGIVVDNENVELIGNVVLHNWDTTQQG